MGYPIGINIGIGIGRQQEDEDMVVDSAKVKKLGSIVDSHAISV